VLGVALLVAAFALGFLPGTAKAATLTATGWWWKANQGLPAAPPAPPTVPEGGLMVAGAPDGATAIAALHFDLGQEETSPVLTLKAAENGDTGGSTAIMAACLSGTAWQPASAGAWAEHPYPACTEGAVQGIRSDDGSWTFALDPLLSEGVLDVTITPGVTPEGVGSVFQLVFQAPTAESLTTTKGTPADSSFEVPDFGATDAGTSADFSTPSFSTGDTSFAPVAPSSAFTPSLPEAETGMTATAPVAQQQNRPLPTQPVSAVADHKNIGILVLVLCGGALLWSAQLPTPAPHKLGTFAGTDPAIPEPVLATTKEPAGLGRFARPRTGAPPRL
jgi:hypothetical protein